MRKLNILIFILMISIFCIFTHYSNASDKETNPCNCELHYNLLDAKTKKIKEMKRRPEKRYVDPEKVLAETLSNLPKSDVLTYAPQISRGFYPEFMNGDLVTKWNDVKGAVKYKLFINGEFITEITESPYIAPAPPEPGDYFYVIVAVDAKGKISPPSEESRYVNYKLEAPSFFECSLINNKLIISWEIVPDALIYDIYKAESVDGPFKLLDVVSRYAIKNEKYIDRNVLSNSFHYYYRIDSKDKTRESREYNILEVWYCCE